MSKKTKRSDLLRLRDIAGKLVEVLDEEDYDFLSLEQKLTCIFAPEKHPIFRRRITKRTPVHGMWWMTESQWLRFLWSGHQATIIKTDLDPDRVLCTRAFDQKGFAYIRDMGTYYDIEAMSKVTKYDPHKKKDLGSAYEWLTVSVSTEEYQKLVEDGYFGPIEDCCKHED